VGDRRDRRADAQEHVIERIVERRVRDGRTQYRVRWSGYDVADDTWETEDAVSDTLALDAFEASEASARAAEVAPPRDVDAAVVVVPARTSAPRRSPRHHDSPAALDVCVAADGDADAVHPQAHMVMSAVRGMHIQATP